MTASPSSINQVSTTPGGGVKPLGSPNPRPFLKIVESQGQVQVHMASFNGSFPVVLSEALRSAGLGSQVVIAQFLKGGVDQGPDKAINLCGNLQWLRPDLPCYLAREKIMENNLSAEFIEAKKAVQSVWLVCKENLLKENINKIVLDEIGLAIKMGFIRKADLIQTLEKRPPSIDVIITGPFIPDEILSMADQVTELRCSK